MCKYRQILLSVNSVVEEIPEIIKEKPISCIRLLGGFQVFNRTGEDITGSFSLNNQTTFCFLTIAFHKRWQGYDFTENR